MATATRVAGDKEGDGEGGKGDGNGNEGGGRQRGKVRQSNGNGNKGGEWQAINGDGNKKDNGYYDKGGRQAMRMARVARVMVLATRVVDKEECNGGKAMATATSVAGGCRTVKRARTAR
jgi:hypothetical protein